MEIKIAYWILVDGHRVETLETINFLTAKEMEQVAKDYAKKRNMCWSRPKIALANKERTKFLYLNK